MDYRYEIYQIYSPNFSHFPLPLHVCMSILYVCVSIPELGSNLNLALSCLNIIYTYYPLVILIDWH